MRRGRSRNGSGQPARRALEVDWGEVRRRLAGAAIRDGDALTPEQADAVLQQRARALAAPAAPLAEVGPGLDGRRAGLEIVVVRIADERYAVAASHVWRVVGAPDIAPVPGASHTLLGVINLHGEVLPVFDPRPVLGLAADAAPARGHVLVLGGDRAELGLAVDAADEVTRLAADQLHAAPDSLAAERRELVRGVTQRGLILLDGARLLADPRLGAAPG